MSGANSGGSGYNHLTDDEFDALLRQRYGDAIARIAATVTPRDRRKDRNTSRMPRTVGAVENPNAEPSAVDHRHHRARREHGA